MTGKRDILLASLIAATSLAASVAVGESIDGEASFNAVCGGCHNIGGTGVPGLAPPLDRPEFWQALGNDAPQYIGGVVTKGFNMPITVRGQRYMGMFMAPMSGSSSEELAAITSWVLGTLGETEQQLTAQQIEEIRNSDLSNNDLRSLRPQSE